MTTDSTTAAHDAHDVHDDHHPTEKQYWVVFVILGALTALEIYWAEAFREPGGGILVWPLIIMMVIKFLLVAGAFMHLWFDMKILNGKLFTWAFMGALVLAMAVFAIVFAAFEFQV